MNLIDEAEILFQETLEEIDKYFNCINNLVKDTQSTIDQEVIHIMKASFYLMLYNLIEATVTKVFDALHEEIAENGFDTLKPSLQYHILRKFKGLKIDITPSNLDATPINTALHKVTLSRLKLFEGNIDAKKIRDTLKHYDLTINLTNSAKGGNKLNLIKNYRNQLAHGDKSFVEIGREAAIEELKNMKTETVNYLQEFINSTRTYISGKHYCP